MQAIRSILVVMEPGQTEGLALKRAKLIAGVTQSQLHLLVCDKKHDHSAFLNDVATSLQQEGFTVSSQQAWHENLHQTIIAVQQAEGCGLVVKQHFPDNPLKKALLTPDDWKLLRYCPGPVLMVKTEKPWRGGTILAAVDVGNSRMKLTFTAPARETINCRCVWAPTLRDATYGRRRGAAKLRVIQGGAGARVA